MYWGRDKTVALIMGLSSAIVAAVLILSGLPFVPLKVKVIELTPTVNERVVKP